MKKPEKKSKRPPGPFSFCPKHSVFYSSCGCKVPGSRIKENGEIEIEEIKEEEPES